MRPSDMEFPLFVHVLGAMLLVGMLLLVAWALVSGWRQGRTERGTTLTRFGLRMLLIGVVPSYIVMRVGAQWTEAAADYPDEFDPGWIGIGYITADLGAVLTLISIILAVIGLRRLRSDAPQPVVARVVTVLSLLMVAAYLIAIFAMTTKPD
jgi:uncharacterized membrane protein